MKQATSEPNALQSLEYVRHLGVDWDYEPDTFEIGEGETYTPDFLLTDFEIYLELKPTVYFSPTSKHYKAVKKFNLPFGMVSRKKVSELKDFLINEVQLNLIKKGELI